MKENLSQSTEPEETYKKTLNEEMDEDAIAKKSRERYLQEWTALKEFVHKNEGEKLNQNISELI
eukprot:snap_masked-scaffold_37-processed-gene-0.6-mRNA-1 protein AED:1.00 eAED:1.00 QI:0/-1/0/0/-1/1/1/0/63